MKRILILILAVVALSVAPNIYATEMSVNMTQKQTQKNKATRVIYKVDIDCESCKKKIVENLSFEKGVKGLNVSLEKRTVTVDYDERKTDSLKIATAINKLGYKIEK